MRSLTTQRDLDALLDTPDEIVLLKHGAHCVISAGARTAVAAFEAERPGTPVVAVEVTGQRALSDYVAERLGVPHESPQVFVLRGGKVAWSAAHGEISADALAGHVGTNAR